DTLKKYPQIKKAVIFGSRAKGSNKQYSDIDIAIFADTDENIPSDIKYDMEELDIVYFVDVVHYEKTSNKELKAHIDRVGIEIFPTA
ncbi:MAG: nucleotidyltransferase domain-containing protein, partial [Treponema sp.]|nr:nucleotidyltransferase domain-containing protein [Treponema sp.]